jgi:molybdopterin converting factor small subunit
MKNIKVKVKFFATLRRFGREKDVELKYGVKVEDLLNILKIPRDEAHLILVNGKKAEIEHTLHDGDEVAMFPPVAGGNSFEESS